MSESRPKILTNNYSIISYNSLVDKILNYNYEKKPSYVCFSNVHATVESVNDLKLRNAINQSSYSVTDGMPLVIALRLLYSIKQDRIPGMDFMPSLMEQAEKKNESVFFYGSTPEILEKIKTRSEMDFPGLKIAGAESPPFKELTQNEKEAYIEQINQSGARYVFVGLGCPKQELWMAENSKKINAILLGVGAAFETYSGMKKMAPAWMRNRSLEWLYRLIQEPGRLFKRYLITNSLFLFLITVQFIRQKVFSIK